MENLELNKVYNMDCLDLMREMVRGGVMADWLIADPPYGINFDNIYEKRGGTQAKTEATAKRFYKAKGCHCLFILRGIFVLSGNF